jgi:mannose-6-phosphate isomerase-like protein (cupin superfamily)
MVPYYLTSDMFGDLGVEVAGGDISNLVHRPVADLHVHDRDEVYLLVSPTIGGAAISVEIEGRTRQVVSPAVVHVPAGARHRFVTTRAERGSYCFGLLCGGRGERREGHP